MAQDAESRRDFTVGSSSSSRERVPFRDLSASELGAGATFSTSPKSTFTFASFGDRLEDEQVSLPGGAVVQAGPTPTVGDLTIMASVANPGTCQQHCAEPKFGSQVSDVPAGGPEVAPDAGLEVSGGSSPSAEPHILRPEGPLATRQLQTPRHSGHSSERKARSVGAFSVGSMGSLPSICEGPGVATAEEDDEEDSGLMERVSSKASVANSLSFRLPLDAEGSHDVTLAARVAERSNSYPSHADLAGWRPEASNARLNPQAFASGTSNAATVFSDADPLSQFGTGGNVCGQSFASEDSDTVRQTLSVGNEVSSPPLQGEHPHLADERSPQHLEATSGGATLQNMQKILEEHGHGGIWTGDVHFPLKVVIAAIQDMLDAKFAELGMRPAQAAPVQHSDVEGKCVVHTTTSEKLQNLRSNIRQHTLNSAASSCKASMQTSDSAKAAIAVQASKALHSLRLFQQPTLKKHRMGMSSIVPCEDPSIAVSQVPVEVLKVPSGDLASEDSFGTIMTRERRTNMSVMSRGQDIKAVEDTVADLVLQGAGFSLSAKLPKHDSLKHGRVFHKHSGDALSSLTDVPRAASSSKVVPQLRPQRSGSAGPSPRVTPIESTIRDAPGFAKQMTPEELALPKSPEGEKYAAEEGAAQDPDGLSECGNEVRMGNGGEDIFMSDAASRMNQVQMNSASRRTSTVELFKERLADLTMDVQNKQQIDMPMSPMGEVETLPPSKKSRCLSFLVFGVAGDMHVCVKLLSSLVVVSCALFLLWRVITQRAGVWLITEPCTAGKDTCWRFVGLLSTVPLAVGALGIIMVTGVLPFALEGSRYGFRGTFNLLHRYCDQVGVKDLWVRGAFNDFIHIWAISILYTVAHVVVHLHDGVGILDILMLDCIGSIFLGLALLLQAFKVCVSCRAMNVMVDCFGCRVAVDPDLGMAMHEWNVLQAVMRKTSSSIERHFIVLTLTASATIPLLLADFFVFGASVRSFSSLVPGVLLTAGIFRMLFIAASVSDKCSRVPSLINSLNFGDGLERMQQHIVEYIVRSSLGFYVSDVRLTTELLIRFMYTWCIVAFGISTSLFSSS